MKVLYITNIPSPYKVEFFNRLAQTCDLTVYFERMSASDRNKSWKSNEKWTFNVLESTSIKLGTDSSVSFDVIRHLRRIQYDVVVFAAYHTVTSMITMQYLRMRHIPFILSSDGGFVKTENIIKRKIKSHFIGMADWYLSPGGKTDDYLSFYGADERNISRYSFTSISKDDVLDVESQYHHKQQYRDELRIIDTDKKILLTVGQMIERKGIDILLRALKGISDNLEVIIVGGTPTEEYKEIIKRENLKNIHFLDFMQKSELKKYYIAADLFVLPTREDIWGLVVIEAMAYGLPIITSDYCNAGIELEKYGLAYTFPSEDSEKLQCKIIDVLQNINTLCSRKVSMDYTYENMVEEHLVAFRAFLDSIKKK